MEILAFVVFVWFIWLGLTDNGRLMMLMKGRTRKEPYRHTDSAFHR